MTAIKRPTRRLYTERASHTAAGMMRRGGGGGLAWIPERPEVETGQGQSGVGLSEIIRLRVAGG